MFTTLTPWPAGFHIRPCSPITETRWPPPPVRCRQNVPKKRQEPWFCSFTPIHALIGQLLWEFWQFILNTS